MTETIILEAEGISTSEIVLTWKIIGGYYACAGTLPTYQTEDQDKIDALRALRAAGQPIGQVFELVKIEWPEPTGTIWYCATIPDTLPEGIELP